VLAFGWCAILAVVLNAAETRSFDLPTGEAGPTLRQFAAQAGQQVIFPESAVAGIKTRAVQGTLAPAEALTRLLAGTGLTFIRDEESGAFAVRVAPSSKSDSLPKAPRVAPLVPAATPNATAVIELSPFDVVDTRNDGYGANRSTSVTLLNQDVAMLPVTTEVMTEAFMRDLNLNGDMSAMVENFGMSAGFASNQNADAAFGSEPGTRQPNAEIKLRGLGTGGIRRDGMIALTGTSSSDAFSTERVEILRGPNALLYQDAGGGGVITAVSKQARFDERASLSFALRTDSFGSLRGEADFNQSYKTGRVWLPRVAVRGAAFLSETRYWRDNVFRKSSGSYLQVAMQFPRTTLRTWYERTADDNYAGITPGFGYNAARVGAGWVPPPEVIARHIGYNKTVPTLSLSTFLGETTAGGANAASTILNGQLNWQNLSTWLVQKEWTPRADTFGASLESRWSRAFSTLIKYMYRDEERDMDYNRSATLYPAGYRLTDINSNAITTDDWTVVAQPPRLYNVSHRYHSFRAAGSLEWNMWGGRIRSTLIPGVDYSSSAQHEWLTDYYEADSNWNPLTTTSAQNLYRFPMPTAIIFNAARPVRYFRPESDTERFTYGGRNWVAQEVAPEFYVPATPDNPWGLPTNSITTNRGNWGRYFKWNRGAFSTMYNEWFDGRFTSMFSLRADRSFKRQFLAAQLYPLEVSSSKVSYNTGLTARVHPALRLFLNYSVAQNPAVNMFPDPLGQPLKDAQNTGVEYGVKSSLLNERINLSLSRYTTDAKNEFFLLGIGGSVNPSGLNGSVPGRGSWSNVDRKSDGYELSIDGAPVRGWMMRLTAGMQQGRTGTDLTYPIYYNDEFHSDASGGVTWANRAPYLVKINPGDNSANAPTQQLTIAMLNNGDANGNYRAILNPVNGAITNRGDIFTAGTTSIVNGNVGTGRTGLPVTANKLEWDDPLGYDGMYIASRSGMRSLGVPRYTVSFTNSYNFSRGWLKGVRVGGLVSARLQQANQVVRWPVTTYVINKAGTLGVKTSTDNAAAAEIPKVDLPGRWIYTDRGLIYGRPDLIGTNAWISYTYKFRRVTWSTQINISNVFNHYQVLPQPFNGTLYGETRGLYYTAEPRSWAWRNDFKF
jgi:outer membrane receptor protein involved in Fe transport